VTKDVSITVRKFGNPSGESLHCRGKNITEDFFD